MKVESNLVRTVDFSGKSGGVSDNNADSNNNAAGQTAQPASVTEATVIKAIEKANKVNIDHQTRAEFSIHAVTKDVIVKIVDTETNEVLREYPPKKILDLIAKLWELAGIVVDERR